MTQPDPIVSEFLHQLSPDLRGVFDSLNTPFAIQEYLDSIPYNAEDLNRSPLRVMQDHQCHCLDGGLLAALALRRLGHPAQIIDLVPEPNMDDDHVLAIFRQNGRLGAVAKSNYVGLRYRDPVYRSYRELVMTYFEPYFSIDGMKTLRGYTRPLRLDAFDRNGWPWSEAGIEKVVARLYSLKMIPVIRADDVSALSPIDRRSYEAYMFGTNVNEVYRPVDQEG